VLGYPWAGMQSKSFPVKTKLLGILATGTAFLLVTIAGGQVQSHRTGEAAQSELRSSVRLRSLDLTLSTMQDLETGQRGFLLTGKREYLEPFERAISEIEGYFEELARLYAGDEASLARISEMAWLKDQKMRELQAAIDLRNLDGLEPAIAYIARGAGKQLMDRFRTLLGEQIAVERDRFVSARQLSEDRQQQHLMAYATLIVAAIVVSTLGYLSLVRQVGENERLSKRLEHEASHDALTGLPNRRFGVEWLNHSVALAKREHTRIALLFIDLDGFKEVNDEFGHKRGDEVLKSVSRTFLELVRESDFLARFGGDEFLVIMPLGAQIGEPAILAKRLIHSLAEPLLPQLGGNRVGASIGIALYPEHAGDTLGLMAAADSAMYAAKQGGKGRYQFFERISQ
jgi:diguanylate cyclase (GGDEF)-like protein